MGAAAAVLQLLPRFCKIGRLRCWLLLYAMDNSGEDEWSDDGSSVDEVEVAQYFAAERPEEANYSDAVGKALQDCDAASSQSVVLTSIVLIMLRAKRKRQRQMRVAVALALTTSVFDLYVTSRGGIQAVECFNAPAYTTACTTFDLDKWQDKEALFWFRFTVAELYLIAEELQVPEFIVTKARDRALGIDVLAMLCMKFAWPRRLGEMLFLFGTCISRISRLIQKLRVYLYQTYSPRMRNPRCVHPDDMEIFGAAIEKKCGHKGIFSFIDGTVRPICKPELLQNILYSGKNRQHSLKYQIVCTPDGIMRHVSGPWPGSRHDQYCLSESNALDWVTGHGMSAEGHPWSTYADAGYSTLPGLIRPWPDAVINIAHMAYNVTMASVRICVEWEFGDIVTHWASLQMRTQQKIFDGSRPGQQYLVAALLSNCRSCLRRNNTSQYFDVLPPSLREYVEGLRN